MKGVNIMPTKLRKLKINRVDLVSAGANEQAVVTFFKRNGEAPTASDAHQAIEMYAEELVDGNSRPPEFRCRNSDI
jgi:hypothetical protein